MGKDSHIEWCDHTFNPWIGCTKVSPGCAHCYAETRDRRHMIEKVDHWGKGAPRLRTSAANWRQPHRWNRNASNSRLIDDAVWLSKGTSQILNRPETKVVLATATSDNGNCVSVGMEREIPEAEWDAAPAWRTRVFSLSQGDWLDPEVDIAWLAAFLALIHATPHLDWLLLTKRPAFASIAESAKSDWERWKGALYMVEAWLRGQPPAHVWIGTTVEDQPRAEERIPLLLAIPARLRFLSCEPLLGPVTLPSLGFTGPNTCVDWVICGGESGPKARPMHPASARSLRDQCAAAVPFFFKQWGEWEELTHAGGWDQSYESEFPKAVVWQRGTWVPCKDADFGTLLEEDEFAPVMHRIGKGHAGRLLDGREHSAFPVSPCPLVPASA
jgi:protein gp37